MQLALTIMYLHPDAVNLQDFIVMDNSDGKGQFIAYWNLPYPKPTTDELNAGWLGYLKKDKLAELSQICQDTIYGGFTGTDGHLYQFQEKDQGNLIAQMLLLVSDPTISVVQWKTADAGIIELTRDQFLQVCKDADSFKRKNFARYWTLEANVKATTTEFEISQIVW